MTIADGYGDGPRPWLVELLADPDGPPVDALAPLCPTGEECAAAEVLLDLRALMIRATTPFLEER